MRKGYEDWNESSGSRIRDYVETFVSHLVSLFNLLGIVKFGCSMPSVWWNVSVGSLLHDVADTYAWYVGGCFVVQ